MFKISLLFAVVISVSICAKAAIFGVDDRQPITARSALSPLAKATAIAVLSANYSVEPNGTIDLDVDAQDKLCKSERFQSDPSLSFTCSAFLVGPDLLATAGHCVYAVNNPGEKLEHETAKACQSFLWLFDYQADENGVTKTKGLPAQNLYRCKEIIYGVENQKPPFDDYALIRLDRKVTDRLPLKIANANPSVGSSVFMFGYPFGTPLKLTGNARVTLSNPARESFLTSLDAFEGDSGGPVLNAQNEVVGILIGGTPSFNTYEDPVRKCELYNRCSENGSNCKWPDKDTSVFPGFQAIGSEVQRIAPIRDLMFKNP